MVDLASNIPEPIKNAPPITNTLDSPPSSRIATSGAILNPFDPRNPLPDGGCDPLYLVPPQTWAQLNPTSGVQKQRPRAKLTDAAKATKKITAECNRAKAALLSAAIDRLRKEQKIQIEEIARDHSRKVCDIKKLVNHNTNYRLSRAPTLSNALTHKKGVELNEGNTCRLHLQLILMDLHAGRDVGDRATLAEIQQAKDDDPDY
jgi:hypothetical protein